MTCNITFSVLTGSTDQSGQLISIHVEGYVENCACARGLFISLSCLNISSKIPSVEIKPGDLSNTDYPNKKKWIADFNLSRFAHSTCACDSNITVTAQCYEYDSNGNAVLVVSQDWPTTLDCNYLPPPPPPPPPDPSSTGGGTTPTGNGNGQGTLCGVLFWTLFSAIILVAISIIAAGCLWFTPYAAYALAAVAAFLLIAIAAFIAWYKLCGHHAGYCSALHRLYNYFGIASTVTYILLAISSGIHAYLAWVATAEAAQIIIANLISCGLGTLVASGCLTTAQSVIITIADKLHCHRWN